jgi:hypothetical protein
MDQPRPPEDDLDEPAVRYGKLAGRILGGAFVVYLVYSLGQLAKLW